MELTTGKLKLCLVVASQRKYLRILFVPVVSRIVLHSQLCAAENVAMCIVLGGANIGAEFRQCLEPL
jgi:hypothetical protein